MIITCPECTSEFDVPFAMIGPGGRKVRCASCRHEWHADGPKPDKPVENPYKPTETKVSATGFEIEFDIFKNAHDAPSFTPVAKGVHKTNKKAKKEPKFKIWAVTILFFLVFTSLFLALQPFIGYVSTHSERIYSGFGLNSSVPGQNLGIDRLNIKQIWGENGNTLEITTKIINLTEIMQPVPAIKIESIGQDGKPTGESWRFDPPAKELGAQESVPFVVKLPAMPKAQGEVISLKASFAR